MDEAESNGAPRPVVSVGDVDDALTSACGNCSKVMYCMFCTGRVFEGRRRVHIIVVGLGVLLFNANHRSLQTMIPGTVCTDFAFFFCGYSTAPFPLFQIHDL